MYLTLDPEEKRLVADLVESRIRELHPTIRRSHVYDCTDSLKHDLEVFDRLHESAMRRETAMQFGQRVRKLREQRGLTQKEVAERLDVSASYVNKVELGIHFVGGTAMPSAGTCKESKLEVARSRRLELGPCRR